MLIRISVMCITGRLHAAPSTAPRILLDSRAVIKSMSEDIHLQTLFPGHRGTELRIECFKAQRIWQIFLIFKRKKQYKKKAPQQNKRLFSFSVVYCGLTHLLMSFLALLSATAWRGLCSTPEKQVSMLLMRLFKNLKKVLREMQEVANHPWYREG